MTRAREFDEDVVLEAAMALFWRNGFQRTSITDLARASGVQRGSLYNAYGDKETMFLKAFRHYGDRFLGEAAAALQKGSLKTRLRRFFEVAIRNMRSGDPAQGCLTTRVIMEASDDNEIIKEALRGLLSKLEAMLQETLSVAKARGEFAGDPAQTARLLVAVTRGMAVIERAYGNEERLRETTRETIRLVTRP